MVESTDLLSVKWIFPPTAAKLLRLAIRTLGELEDALKTQPDLLNHSEKIWLKYHPTTTTTTTTSIQCAVLLQHFRLVSGVIEAMFPGVYEVVCAGSYRRMKDTCGDVDILVTPKDDREIGSEVEKLVNRLQSDGYLVDVIGQTKANRDGTLVSPHAVYGIGRLPGYPTHRRVDIIFQGRSERVHGLQYFTGSADFNDTLRIYARRHGYNLMDQGLARVLEDGQEVAVDPPCVTEEDIFTRLGLPYRSPADREADDTWLAICRLTKGDLDAEWQPGGVGAAGGGGGGGGGVWDNVFTQTYTPGRRAHIRAWRKMTVDEKLRRIEEYVENKGDEGAANDASDVSTDG